MSVLRDIRRSAGLSQRAFGELFHVDQTTVSKWERGISFPDLTLGLKISEHFGVSLDKLYHNPLSFDTLSLPVYSKYHTDCDRSVIDRTETFDTNYREIAYYLRNSTPPSSMVSDNEIIDSFVAIRISGDEMEPRFCENDLVLILKGCEEWDGQVCAVCIENAPARLYRLMKHKNGISLLSYNASCEPVFVPRSELERGKTSIIGRAIGLRGQIR